MKKITLLWLLSLIVIVLQTRSHGSVISYMLDITSGGADTSGGITGNGVGHLSLEGRFKLIIDSNTGQANLENISISFGKSFYSLFDWSSLKGTFNLGTVYLSSPCSICSTCDNYLSGDFDGNTAFLHGDVSQCAYDGYYYSCTIKAKVIPTFVFPKLAYAGGEIWGWGGNGDGQCNVPEPNAGFIAIAAGSYHSLGLKSDGSIVAWGYNEHGECNVPSINTDFVAIEAGGAHSLGLKQDGSIVAWGYNEYGECNVPSPNTDFVAIEAGGAHSLGLKQDGSIVAWGSNYFGECNVPQPNTGFSSIAAGEYHSLGLKQDGSIVAWGGNWSGQCDVPEPNAGFSSITAGVYHSLGLKTDGSIAAWGNNDSGQCDVPLPNTDFVAISACGHNSLGLKRDGSIVAWGSNGTGQCNVPEPNKDFSSISAGLWHSLGLKKYNIAITKCTVTAGKTQKQDAFSISGKFECPAQLNLNEVNHIDINIISLADNASIYREIIYSRVVNGKFKYTRKIPNGRSGAITSLTVDFNRKLFSIKAQNVNLTGLSCLLRLQLSLSSDIVPSGDANEPIVNGKNKLIPTRLMRTYRDILVVNKSKARHNSTKASSDTLSVTGDIAVIDTDVNLCNVDVNFVWGQQLFSVPPKSFKAYRTGHLFKCSKVAADANGNTGVVTAMVDTDKAAFKLSVNGADAIDAASASIPFGIRFADFNETADVNRATGRSW